MAVTKIRKISSWTLVVISLVSVGIFALFFFGGDDTPMGAKGLKNPAYTEELLYWTYFLFALSALALLVFGIMQFVNSFIVKPKSALVSLGVLIVFAILLVGTYSMGDGTPLSSIKEGSDLQAYNIPFWLKVTEMWLYSMYILIVLVVIAVIWGSIKKVFDNF